MTSLAAGNDAFAFALTTAMQAGVALDRATDVPWVVTLEFTHPAYEGTHRLINLVQAPLSKRPEASDHMPAGSTLLREDTFPAERFEQMAREVRPRYFAQYRQFFLWREAHSRGKDAADMVAFEDYDPVAIDYAVERWVRPGSNPLGD